jgi:uncharacterized protein (TIGR02594 family)
MDESPDPPWLQFAQAEVGAHVAEIPGPGANPRIIEYHHQTDLKATSDEIPWCSAFVNWCIWMSKLRGTGSAIARSWLAWGDPCEARRGAIAVFRRGKSTWAGHVGFLLEEGPTTLKVLGGNQHDAVCVGTFKKSDLLGYRWPRQA